MLLSLDAEEVQEEGDGMNDIQPPVYCRMPEWLDRYHTEVRKAPGTWMNCPYGILVPPKLWDSGEYLLPRYDLVRAHEEVHWVRMKNRPYISQWWWVVHYCISQEMAYREEILAYRLELSLTTPDDVESLAWFIECISCDYGFHKTREEITIDLTSKEY